MSELPVKFRINNELITLYEPVDGSDHLFKLTNNDKFAAQYLNDLINNGFISLLEPVSFMYRVDDNDIEQLIYPIDNAIDNPLSVRATISFNPLSVEENETSQTSKEISVWSAAETKMLLDLYEEFLSEIGPQKKFKTKKVMWGKIAEMINTAFGNKITGIQCENRYKTVLKRKKAAVDNNHTSGSSRAVIPFEEELNKIAALDDSIEPEVLGSIQSIKVLKPPLLDPTNKVLPTNCLNNEKNLSTSLENDNCTSFQENTSSENSLRKTPTLAQKRQKLCTVQETLWKIHEKKEEAKERRHKEKLQLVREIFGNKENANT